MPSIVCLVQPNLFDDKYLAALLAVISLVGTFANLLCQELSVPFTSDSLKRANCQ